MKPHYILRNGKIIRVGVLNGVRVTLSTVGRSCTDCVFKQTSCPGILESQTILGVDCTDKPPEQSHYEAV